MNAVRSDVAFFAEAGDRRSPARLLAALVIPIGPAAVAVLRYVLPYNTTDDNATVVEKVLAAPGRQSLVLWLGFVAILTLVPGAIWVGRLTSARAPRLTMVALSLLVPGYLALAWLAATDLLVWMGADAGLDAGTLTRLLGAVHPTSDIAGALFVAGHVLGTVLLGLAMWVSGAVPRWAAVLTIVSQPLHFVAAVVLASHPLDLAAWGMQAVGFAAAAYFFVGFQTTSAVGPRRTGTSSLR
jgi:hypothetical protein